MYDIYFFLLGFGVVFILYLFVFLISNCDSFVSQLVNSAGSMDPHLNAWNERK